MNPVLLFAALVVAMFLCGWTVESYLQRQYRPQRPTQPLGFEQTRTSVEGEDDVERWILAGGPATLEEYLTSRNPRVDPTPTLYAVRFP